MMNWLSQVLRLELGREEARGNELALAGFGVPWGGAARVMKAAPPGHWLQGSLRGGHREWSAAVTESL
jgi:hypothetical protein